MKAKELNGYYYCFSFDEWSHDLYSITEMSRKEAILTAIDNGVRLYLVKYRKGKQQGNKKRIAPVDAAEIPYMVNLNYFSIPASLRIFATTSVG